MLYHIQFLHNSLYMYMYITYQQQDVCHIDTYMFPLINPRGSRIFGNIAK